MTTQDEAVPFGPRQAREALTRRCGEKGGALAKAARSSVHAREVEIVVFLVFGLVDERIEQDMKRPENVENTHRMPPRFRRGPRQTPRRAARTRESSIRPRKRTRASRACRSARDCARTMQRMRSRARRAGRCLNVCSRHKTSPLARRGAKAHRCWAPCARRFAFALRAHVNIRRHRPQARMHNSRAARPWDRARRRSRDEARGTLALPRPDGGRRDYRGNRRSSRAA